MQERERELRLKLASVLPLMNELQRRIVVAAEARAYGRGGVQTLAQITGMSRQTIYRGLQELLAKRKKPSGRIRRPGGGRKRLRDQYPRLVETLERLIEPTVRGDPQTLLRWTCKSVRNLEAELEREGYTVSYRTIANLLHAQEYTLQANRKSREGQEDHPDRDAQFRYINDQAMQFLKRTVPVISVDTKKKELLGNYKNAGREWQRQGEGWDVLAHDFPDPSVPKAVPYGVYDLAANTGWVNVGMDADTAEFAVESIRQWWQHMGKPRYSRARALLICADSGGSNGYRLHLWKRELQRLATREQLAITVCHFPPGTS